MLLYSIRTKFTLLTVFAIIASLSIATLLGVLSIRNLGNSDVDQILFLMCRTGKMNLESYFGSVEQSVNTVSTLVQSDLDKMPEDQMPSHVERCRNLFGKVAYQTNGVLTYYYRIDPEVSKDESGFWYVNLDGKGFAEHRVTDISLYDTNDTSRLVWFTVPKATKKGLWLPPYVTDNLDVQVISYNTPVYRKDRFIGVIGIEIDYRTLAHEVENIRLYDHGYAFLMDAAGNMIYHPRMDLVELDKLEHLGMPPGLISDSSRIHYRYRGVEKEGVWLPLSNGMRLYLTVPVSEVNKSWQGLIRNIILMSLIVLLFVSFLTMRFAGHITKPLQDLTEAAREADKGNYDFKLDYDKNDEIGQLTHTFRQMAVHVKDHISNLGRQAYTDALTSVRNKAAFSDYINELQNRLDASGGQMQFAMGVLDCDNLKMINDEYGHDKGDIYLKGASQLICRVFKHSPVFRLGGDEFAVVLENEDFQNRETLISLFRNSREVLSHKEGAPWEKVSVTMGLAVYNPETDTSVKDVVRRADKKMYENKRIRKKGR